MNSEKYRLLFDKIPSDASIALRQYARAGELKPVNGGYTLKSGCPFHGGKEPGSFFVYNDGHYHCFSCQAHGRIIDFVAQIYGCSAYEAAEKIAEEEGLVDATGKNYKKDFKPVVVKPVTETVKLDYELLDKFYAYLQKWFGINRTDEKKLREERFLSLIRIRRDYFSFSTNGRNVKDLFVGFKKLYPEYTDKQIASVPGVYLRDNELNLVAFNGIGILIRDADEKIVGVQCRRDRVEKGQAKYIWLSSATASEWKNCSGGASCGSPQDVLYPVIARNRCNICIAEGKFKTEILAQQGNTGISVQGVGNFKGIETQIKKVCEKCKINGIYIFYDGDSLKNTGVFKQLRALYDTLTENTGLPVKIALWNEHNGKGIDDLYLSHEGKISGLVKYVDDSFFSVYDGILMKLEKETGKLLEKLGKGSERNIFLKQLEEQVLNNYNL